MSCFFVGNTGAHHGAQTTNQLFTNTAILDLIYRQKYDDAITRLEEVLEREPQNGDALTYMATAKLYQTRDFFKARMEFEEAFKAGGGATFFVTHSHEKFNTNYVADYCRGWLHLRSQAVEYVPTDGTHSFKLKYSEIEEFKINRLSKRAFHIKFNGKSQNFYGRSNTEFEPLLIIALQKSFSRS
ncbi:MAG TPA: tetratricopeptide repeat protein [Pyrinomonadaceae bacterium]